MDRFIAWTFRHWWLFPFMGIACSLMVIPSIEYGNGIVGSLLILLFGVFALLSLLTQLFVIILALVQKQWQIAARLFFSGAVSLVAFCAIPLLVLSIYMMSLPDDFGSKHPIPEDMDCNLPMGYIDSSNNHIDRPYYESNRPEKAAIDSLSESTWLQIWNGIQGGIYVYDFYYPRLPDGTVYLRCYEATENILLSSSSIEKDSKVSVISHNSFNKIVNHKEFHIYEGDWGDYYAVRVEVWHHDTSTGKDSKLVEKTYRMEGWMR